MFKQITKRIIRSQIGGLILKYAPATLILSLHYKISLGKYPNIKNPQTLNEKLQWKKLYDHNPFYTICADKYAVRDFVAKRIGKKYLIPLLAISDKPEKIDFDKIPVPFIIKANHSSGQNIIIRNKSEINKKELSKKCREWLNSNYSLFGEWQYKNIKPKIVVERLLLDKEKKVPEDYKFHCFNGKVEFLQITTDRFGNKKVTNLDANWRILPFKWCATKNGHPAYEINRNLKKPKNFKEMIKLAEKLSEGFDYIRVDLYSLKNKIYFGELTFHHGAGFEKFYPNKWDLYYGNKIKLHTFSSSANSQHKPD